MTRALAIAFLLAVLAAVWQWRSATAADGRAQVAVGQRDAATKAQRDEAAARLTESKRTKRMQENQDAEFLARLAAQRDAVAARAAVDGVREQARLLSRASCPARYSATTSSGPPATDGPDLLADVLGELATRADRLAEQADSARIAGQLCERSYDALTIYPGN